MQIPKTSIDELRRKLTARVITPDEAEYDEARKVWNADVDRRRPQSRNLATSLTCRRPWALPGRRNLPVAVRSGGHSEIESPKAPWPLAGC